MWNKKEKSIKMRELNTDAQHRVVINEVLLPEAIRKFVNIIKDNSSIELRQLKENAIHT